MTSMVDVSYDRDRLVRLFEGGGISSAELRDLLASRPGALTRMLTSEFIEQVGALRRGDLKEVEVRGFIISAPSHFEAPFLGAKPRLERLVGPTSLGVVSPSPVVATYALPAVVPHAVSPPKELHRARFVRAHATLLSLETFGGAPARFLLVNALQVLGFEDFYTSGPPTLDGRDVMALLQERLNLGYSEVRTALLLHLFSAPPYMQQAGGTGLSLLACEDRGRCLTKGALDGVLDDLRYALPPYMTGRRVSGTMDYLGIRGIPLRYEPTRLSWRFKATEAEAISFLRSRSAPGVGDEVSISTRSVLEMHDFERPVKELVMNRSTRQVMLSACDLPLLLARDELARDERARELHEHSEDIAHAVMYAVARVPATVLELERRGPLVDHILRDIHKDWPDLATLMRGEAFINLGARGGLIEHATRAAGASARAFGGPVEATTRTVEEMYVNVFSRFYGELEPKIRHVVAYMEERERQLLAQMERDLLDALEGAFLQLDAQWPDGWPYAEFERLVLSRVKLGRAKLRTKFKLLQGEGEVYEVTDGVFRRVWGLSRFL